MDGMGVETDLDTLFCVLLGRLYQSKTLPVFKEVKQILNTSVFAQEKALFVFSPTNSSALLIANPTIRDVAPPHTETHSYTPQATVYQQG